LGCKNKNRNKASQRTVLDGGEECFKSPVNDGICFKTSAPSTKVYFPEQSGREGISTTHLNDEQLSEWSYREIYLLFDWNVYQHQWNHETTGILRPILMVRCSMLSVSTYRSQLAENSKMKCQDVGKNEGRRVRARRAFRLRGHLHLYYQLLRPLLGYWMESTERAQDLLGLAGPQKD